MELPTIPQSTKDVPTLRDRRLHKGNVASELLLTSCIHSQTTTDFILRCPAITPAPPPTTLFAVYALIIAVNK